MKATRRTQPYRAQMDRPPSAVLAKMQAGRSATGQALAASRGSRPRSRSPFPGGRTGVRIPRA